MNFDSQGPSDEPHTNRIETKAQQLPVGPRDLLRGSAVLARVQASGVCLIVASTPRARCCRWLLGYIFKTLKVSSRYGKAHSGAEKTISIFLE